MSTSVRSSSRFGPEGGPGVASAATAKTRSANPGREKTSRGSDRQPAISSARAEDVGVAAHGRGQRGADPGADVLRQRRGRA